LTGASPKNLLYVDGVPDKKISSDNLVDEIEEKVREKILQRNSTNIIARG
jgi:(E)-4-hydroxy-3-methylbut-2-enyl-diphosphate synthase